MKEGYEPDVVNDDNDSSGTDEDFDIEKECARNDDSDDEFVAKRYTTSEDSESRRYRTRNSVDALKKPEQLAKPKEPERRKDRNSSSDEEGDGVRQVKNFMVSSTMPLTNEPEEGKRKSIRKMYEKHEAVYIMDAKKAGNIGRYFNVSALWNEKKKIEERKRMLTFFSFAPLNSPCSIPVDPISLFRMFSSIRMTYDSRGWHSLHRRTLELERNSHGTITTKWAVCQIKF